MKLIFEELTEKILEAASSVHAELSAGFLESIYENALKLEVRRRSIPFESQVEQSVLYSGVEVGKRKIDLIVDKKVVVELKTVSNLEAAHFSQLKSYLKATDLKVGLLINFSKEKIKAKRFVL